MATQTTYSRYFTGPKPGSDSDQEDGYKREGLNKTGADMDLGVALCQHSTIDSGVILPATAADRLIGISLNDQGRNPNGLTTGAYAANKMLPTKARGAIYVQIDQDVKPTDPVFVRFAASGNGQTGVVGSFRKDGDGAAQVITVTPTAADSTVYSLDVSVGGKVFHFAATSQVSATATTIATQFRVAMAANAQFSALVTASGTTTLILTRNIHNESFTVSKGVENAGTIAVAFTTAPSGTARYCPTLRWLSSGTAANGTGELYFDAEKP